MKLRKDALVEIREGRHASLYGRVVDFRELKEEPGDSLCSVRLQINEEIVPVKHSELQVIDEHSLPKDHPALLSPEQYRKLKAADAEMLGGLANGLKRIEESSSSNGTHTSNSSSVSSSNSSSSSKRSGQKRSRSRSRDGGGSERKSSSSSNSSSSLSDKKQKSDRNGREEKPITWVVPHIRVRIINKHFNGGKYYNLKGRVDDVVSVSRFTVVLDGGGNILEGMLEKDVETALPKVGGNVMILRGEHKGEVGKLLERSSNTSVAAVQLESEMEVIKSSFDDIAEHVPP
jgi:hypothetical protein